MTTALTRSSAALATLIMSSIVWLFVSLAAFVTGNLLVGVAALARTWSGGAAITP